MDGTEQSETPFLKETELTEFLTKLIRTNPTVTSAIYAVACSCPNPVAR